MHTLPAVLGKVAGPLSPSTSTSPVETQTGVQVSSVDGFAWGSVVVGGHPLDTANEFDRRLAEGCAIACRLRGGIKEQLGALRLPACKLMHTLCQRASACFLCSCACQVQPRALA